MLFDDPARRYPHLHQALNRLSRQPDSAGGVGEAGAVIVVVAFAALVGIVPRSLEMPVLLGAVVLMGALLYHRRRRAKPDERALEVAGLAQRMSLLMAKKRLHRDLDAGSLTLLDECARQWLRARATLEGTAWKSGTLPEPYRAVRTQSLTAVDDAMTDALLHYRDVLPAEVVHRPAADYVDEALDNIVHGPGRRDDRFPPTAFGPVREIADRLRDFADESERLGRSFAAHELDPPDPRPSLERTLADLRAIRDAEEELRHDIRS
jgi:hypothetical protein